MHSRKWREEYSKSLPEGYACEKTEKFKVFHFADGSSTGHRVAVWKIPIFLGNRPGFEAPHFKRISQHQNLLSPHHPFVAPRFWLYLTPQSEAFGIQLADLRRPIARRPGTTWLEKASRKCRKPPVGWGLALISDLFWGGAPACVGGC